MKNNRNPHTKRNRFQNSEPVSFCTLLKPILSSIKTKFSYCFYDAKVLTTFYCAFDINQKETFFKQKIKRSYTYKIPERTRLNVSGVISR